MRRSAAKPQKGFLDGYKTYDPQTEGYGTAAEWRGEFYHRMGFEEASRVKEEAKRQGTWRSEQTIIGEMAGVHLSESSVWTEIKAAFRKAAMNCHPDRSKVHGKSKETAEAEFKQVSAAYAILARQHGEG